MGASETLNMLHTVLALLCLLSIMAQADNRRLLTGANLTTQQWNYTRAPGYHRGLHRSRFGLQNNDLPPDQRGPCTFDGPITCPFISTFQELVNWNETQAKQQKANPFTPAPKDPGTPVLYMINDFNGGYNEDVDVYYRKGFGGWDVVDAFVYFGHTHVTVPPVAWINDCHARNISILGTMIVEDYAAAKSLADNQEAVVVQLARLAEYYGFDGWLINIEADYKPDKAKQLLSRLETELHKRRGLGASVMMYDSLTANGDNGYQNALDDQNYGYFNESSTLLTNYWMDAAGDALRKSVETAGDRASDVVIGIDCFGRETYYRAGLVDVPIRQVVAVKKNLSVGIYSPGWTYQLYPGRDGDGDRPKCGRSDAVSRATCQDWINRDKKFWIGIKDAWKGGPAPPSPPAPPAPTEKCCTDCVAPQVKYFSVDVPHGFCGETCIRPRSFGLFHLFEKNLTKAIDNTPCIEQFTPTGGHYTNYTSTVTHGVPGLKVTLDLYGPV